MSTENNSPIAIGLVEGGGVMTPPPTPQPPDSTTSPTASPAKNKQPLEHSLSNEPMQFDTVNIADHFEQTNSASFLLLNTLDIESRAALDYFVAMVINKQEAAPDIPAVLAFVQSPSLV